jgi:hypothetical protein
MDPNIEIPKHYHTQFSNAVELLLQYEGSMLEPFVRVMPFTGEKAEVIKQFGDTEFRDDNQRGDDTPNMEVTRDSRWIFPHDVDWGYLFERKDDLRMIIDQQGPLLRAAANALGKKTDQIIVNEGIFGDVKTGRNAGTTVSFPSGQKVAATVGGGGSATGMNLAKLRAARKKLAAAYISPRAKLYMAITENQHDELLGETQVTSAAGAEGRQGQLFPGVEFHRDPEHVGHHPGRRFGLPPLPGLGRRRDRAGQVERPGHPDRAGPGEEVQHPRLHGADVGRHPHPGKEGRRGGLRRIVRRARTIRHCFAAGPERPVVAADRGDFTWRTNTGLPRSAKRTAPRCRSTPGSAAWAACA